MPAQSPRCCSAIMRMPDPDRITKGPSRIGSMAAAAGMILLGTQVIDPVDDSSYSREDRQRKYAGLGWFPRRIRAQATDRCALLGWSRC